MTDENTDTDVVIVIHGPDGQVIQEIRCLRYVPPVPEHAVDGYPANEDESDRVWEAPCCHSR